MVWLTRQRYAVPVGIVPTLPASRSMYSVHQAPAPNASPVVARLGQRTTPLTRSAIQQSDAGLPISSFTL